MKKRLKNPIVELRHKMAAKKYWSMFVGDKAYKTNFFLRFLTPTSNHRFRKDISAVNSYGVKMIVIWQMIFIILNFSVKFREITFLETFLLMLMALLSYYFVYLRANLFVSRFTLVLMNLYFIVWMRLDPNSTWTLLVFVTSILDSMFALEWYKHLVITWAQLMFLNCLQGCIWMVFLEIITYSTYELMTKRNWVYKDTSK